MFFFKPKKVILDCFTKNEAVYEHARISPSKNHIPKWWRDIPLPDKNVLNPDLNMRYCAGFIDQYMNSFTLPLWSDINIEVGAKGSDYFAWQYADDGCDALDHAPHQWGSFFSIKDYAQLKLNSPWMMRSKESVKIAYTEPTYNLLHSGIRVLNGVLDFKYQPSVNANIIIERKPETHIVQLKFLTPLAHLTPMTERKVELKHHLVSEKEMKALPHRRFTFMGKYYTNKSLMDKKSPSKCPFNRAISKIKGVDNE
jgi:hypothetical protein